MAVLERFSRTESNAIGLAEIGRRYCECGDRTRPVGCCSRAAAFPSYLSHFLLEIVRTTMILNSLFNNRFCRCSCHLENQWR